jgi:hypothetical protein
MSDVAKYTIAAILGILALFGITLGGRAAWEHHEAILDLFLKIFDSVTGDDGFKDASALWWFS